MKFSCEKEQLQTALTIAARNVSPKSTIQALEGILIQVKDTLTVTGFNLETGVRATVAASIEEEGTLVLSARLFLEIIRKMPNQEIFISTKDYWVTISCGQSQFQIMGIDPEEYPELPDVSRHQGMVVGQTTLKSMINTTHFAISTNEGRVIHTGSLFEVENERLTLVSVDGYRLALRREGLDEVFGGDSFSFVVPGSALSEVEKICNGEDEVTISVSNQHVLFSLSGMILVTRRLEGEFLAYRTAIPEENPVIVHGGRRDLLSAIDRVSLMISEKTKAPLRCVFGNEQVEMSSKTAIGEAKDLCPLTGNGNDLEIGFNHRYLQEALRAAPADKVRMEFSTPVAPCLILPEKMEDDSFCFMVLPVRLKAN